MKNITVLETGKQYTLLNRGTQYDPYVVAWKYNPIDQDWAAGHYFDDLTAAKKFMVKAEKRMEG